MRALFMFGSFLSSEAEIEERVICRIDKQNAAHREHPRIGDNLEGINGINGTGLSAPQLLQSVIEREAADQCDNQQEQIVPD